MEYHEKYKPISDTEIKKDKDGNTIPDLRVVLSEYEFAVITALNEIKLALLKR